MITDKHLKILNQLRKNSRKSLVVISRETNIKVPEIYSLIDDLLNKGILKRCTSIINHEDIGYGFNILFNVESNSPKEFEDYIKSSNNINNAFLLSKSNFTLQCYFKDMNEIEKFKDALKYSNIVNSFTDHYVLDTLRQEDFYLNN